MVAGFLAGCSQGLSVEDACAEIVVIDDGVLEGLEPASENFNESNLLFGSERFRTMAAELNELAIEDEKLAQDVSALAGAALLAAEAFNVPDLSSATEAELDAIADNVSYLVAALAPITVACP